jgi:hypothetical protein
VCIGCGRSPGSFSIKTPFLEIRRTYLLPLPLSLSQKVLPFLLYYDHLSCSRVVKAKKNEINMDTGVFAEEYGQIFLHICTTVATDYVDNRCYQQVLDKYATSDPNFLPMFHGCLDTILTWTLRTKEEEMARMKRNHPLLENAYERSYVAMLSSTVDPSALASQTTCCIPILDDFMVHFIGRVVVDPSVRAVGSIRGWDRNVFRALVSNLLRQTFLDCIQYVSVPNIENQRAQAAEPQMQGVVEKKEEKEKKPIVLLANDTEEEEKKEEQPEDCEVEVVQVAEEEEEEEGPATGTVFVNPSGFVFQ